MPYATPQIRTTSRPTSRILASSIIDLTADIDDLIPLPRSHASPDVSHIKPNPSLPKPPSSTRNAYNSPKGSPYTLSQPARKLRSSLSVRNANSRPHASNLPPNGPQLKVGGTLPNVSNPKVCNSCVARPVSCCRRFTDEYSAAFSKHYEMRPSPKRREA